MYMCVLCTYMCVYIGARTHMHMLVCLLHVLCGHVSVRGCAWAHMCVLLTLWGGAKVGGAAGGPSWLF